MAQEKGGTIMDGLSATDGVPATEHVAAELGRVIGPLRRAILRAARSAEGLPDLPDAHIQILRALAVRSPQTSGELAAGLNLARPTVSNVIGAMITAHLLTRAAGPDDLRQAWISPTDHARELLIRYDRASYAILDHALAEMGPAQRAAVAAALPVLEELTIALTHGSAETATRQR